MATGSESEEEKHVLPKHGWRVPLNNTYSHKPQPCYIPRWSQIPKLIGLGWRFVANFFALVVYMSVSFLNLSA